MSSSHMVKAHGPQRPHILSSCMHRSCGTCLRTRAGGGSQPGRLPNKPPEAGQATSGQPALHPRSCLGQLELCLWKLPRCGEPQELEGSLGHLYIDR